MRFQLVACLISQLCVAEEPLAQQSMGPVPQLLYEVYNSVPIRSYGSKLADGSANCSILLDIVIVQDATASFKDDYEQLRLSQIKLMVDAISERHPGSHYGIVSFRDKPVLTLGEPFDYCHRVDMVLKKVNFDDIYRVYGVLYPNGGGDPAENQLGALIAAVETKSLGWRSNATKLVVLATDALPHFEGDGLNKYGMEVYSGHLEDDEFSQCIEQYYPSAAQVAAVLKKESVHVGFLVDFENEAVAKSWTWFNSYLGQADAYVQSLANDSSNFWGSLDTVLKQVEIEECGAPEVQIALKNRPSRMRLIIEN